MKSVKSRVSPSPLKDIISVLTASDTSARSLKKNSAGIACFAPSALCSCIKSNSATFKRYLGFWTRRCRISASCFNKKKIQRFLQDQSWWVALRKSTGHLCTLSLPTSPHPFPPPSELPHFDGWFSIAFFLSSTLNVRTCLRVQYKVWQYEWGQWLLCEKRRLTTISTIRDSSVLASASTSWLSGIGLKSLTSTNLDGSLICIAPPNSSRCSKTSPIVTSPSCSRHVKQACNLFIHRKQTIPNSQCAK